MAPERPFSSVRFSSADLTPEAWSAQWREYCVRMALSLEFVPSPNEKLMCTAVSRELPGLQMLSVALPEVRGTRTQKHGSNCNDDFTLIVNRMGTVVTSACGRDVTLREGDAIWMNNRDALSFDRRSRGRCVSLGIPGSVLSSTVVDSGNAVMRHIPQHVGALKLLTGYSCALLHDEGLDSPEIRNVAVNHVHDLVALTLGATRDAAEVAKNRGVPAARLKLAKAYISENSFRRGLTVGAVSAHLGLTPRNLQRLFEIEGTTFSSFLLSRRLTRAYRMLVEPKFAGTAVSTIAYDVGFGDLSYFNRCFKQRYGATPRDIRSCGAEYASK